LPADVALDPLSIEDPARRQRMFDCFAWRTFVALSWPAGERRGEADRQRNFGDLDGTETVWESYKATYELFQPERAGWDPSTPGNPAGEWNSPRPVPSSCPQGAAAETPALVMISKSNSRFPDVANETGQAFAGQFGTLTDRNGQHVRYQVLFNEKEFYFLLPSATTARLTPAGPGGGAGVFLPDGATEVKAAWKILCTEPGCQPVDRRQDYYSREVLLFDADNGSCELAEVGLVGLHAVVKTFWAPQWIWATFEHEDNAPLAGSEETGSDRFSFYDPACQAPPDPYFVACSAQPFLAPMGKANPCCPNVVINRWPGVGYGDDQPNQLTRLVPIAGSGLNQPFAAALAGTPFAHYRLVDTQWPLNGRRPAPPGEPRPVNTRLCPGQRDSPVEPPTPPPADPDCYTMVPEFLRNTAIESYMTTYEMRHGQVEQVSNRSCMGCHASGTDFSYIWADAVEQVVAIPAADGGP
jgi:hypothetical protein